MTFTEKDRAIIGNIEQKWREHVGQGGNDASFRKLFDYPGGEHWLHIWTVGRQTPRS